MSIVLNSRCPVYLLGFIGGILESVTSDDPCITYNREAANHLDIFTTTLGAVGSDSTYQNATMGVIDNSQGFIGTEAPFMRSGPLIGDYGIDNYLFKAFVQQLDKPYKGVSYGKAGMLAVNDSLFESQGRITIYYSSKFSKDPYWFFITVNKIKV